MKDAGIAVDLFDVENVKKLSGKDYSFLILGSPTKFGTMSLTIRSFLGKVKTEEWRNKPFITFDTENPENIEKKQGSAAEKIAEKLKDKKLTPLLPVLKAAVLGMKGPIVDGEIERTKEFTRELVLKLKEGLV